MFDQFKLQQQNQKSTSKNQKYNKDLKSHGIEIKINNQLKDD